MASNRKNTRNEAESRIALAHTITDPGRSFRCVGGVPQSPAFEFRENGVPTNRRPLATHCLSAKKDARIVRPSKPSASLASTKRLRFRNTQFHDVPSDLPFPQLSCWLHENFTRESKPVLEGDEAVNEGVQHPSVAIATVALARNRNDLFLSNIDLINMGNSEHNLTVHRKKMPGMSIAARAAPAGTKQFGPKRNYLAIANRRRSFGNPGASADGEIFNRWASSLTAIGSFASKDKAAMDASPPI